MKLLQRVMLLIRANINDMVEKSDDPEQMLRQLQQDLRNQMVQVKTQVATAIAQEHTLQSRCDELTKQADSWQQKAALAVMHGDDAQARRALQQRLDVLRLLESYRRQHEEQQHLIVTMRNALKQLQAKTEETDLTIELFQMRRRRAQLQQAVYEGLARAQQDETHEHVRRAEEKLMDDEARAAAMREEAQRYNLDGQLGQLSRQEAVEEQLHQMKQRSQPEPPTPRQLPPPGADLPAPLEPPLAAPAQPAAAERPEERPALPAPERNATIPSLLDEQVEELLQQQRRARQPRSRTTPSRAHRDHAARKPVSSD
jgi:phage shock protein A